MPLLPKSWRDLPLDLLPTNPAWTGSGPEPDITTAVGGEDHTEGKCTEGISAMRRAYPYELGERDWTVATLLRASPSWQERPVAYLMRGRPVRRLVYLTNFQSQVSCPSSPCVNTVSAVSTAVSHWLKPARRWPLRLSFQVQGASRDTVASWVVPQRSSWMRSSRNASEVENTACGPRWRQGRRTAARGEIAHWSRCRSTWGAAGSTQDERSEARGGLQELPSPKTSGRALIVVSAVTSGKAGAFRLLGQPWGQVQHPSAIIHRPHESP